MGREAFNDLGFGGIQGLITTAQKRIGTLNGAFDEVGEGFHGMGFFRIGCSLVGY